MLLPRTVVECVLSVLVEYLGKVDERKVTFRKEDALGSAQGLNGVHRDIGIDLIADAVALQLSGGQQGGA